mmetsp:Transcript_56932/g.133120  ORF Transcript_56932/g.133120 Transcript_56932/m.133120 type:complete len:97 (-) Transcript_56932:422-712(-)
MTSNLGPAESGLRDEHELGLGGRDVHDDPPAVEGRFWPAPNDAFIASKKASVGGKKLPDGHRRRERRGDGYVADVVRPTGIRVRVPKAARADGRAD